MGGFVVRMALIVALMFLLNAFGWFSPVAFALAVVPATVVLLAFEMKLVAGGLGTELQLPARQLDRWAGWPVRSLALVSFLATEFHRPSTKDFVFGVLEPRDQARAGGSACYNFPFFLLTLAVVAFLAMFFLAFRSPKVVPGKFQLVMESGLEFVKNQVVLGMIGPQGLPFLPFLATFFFLILLGNILEVTPFVMFPANRVHRLPHRVLALISWVTFNVVGIRKHGLVGYLKMVLFPPGAPPGCIRC